MLNQGANLMPTTHNPALVRANSRAKIQSLIKELSSKTGLSEDKFEYLLEVLKFKDDTKDTIRFLIGLRTRRPEVLAFGYDEYMTKVKRHYEHKSQLVRQFHAFLNNAEQSTPDFRDVGPAHDEQEYKEDKMTFSEDLSLWDNDIDVSIERKR